MSPPPFERDVESGDATAALKERAEQPIDEIARHARSRVIGASALILKLGREEREADFGTVPDTIAILLLDNVPGAGLRLETHRLPRVTGS